MSGGIEILAHEDTPLGLICLRRRELLSRPGTFVHEITLNHEFLMSSYHTRSEQALASGALAAHDGKGLDVLVGGLGLGYTAFEVLASDRVDRVEGVELLPQVLDWYDRELFPLAGTLKADARFSVTEGDVYARLAGSPSRLHDLILVDVDHSPADRLDPGNTPFYTEAGLIAARAHLKPGGVLAVWSYAPSSPFAESLSAVFGEITVTEVAFHNDLVDQDISDWLFIARDERRS